MNQNNCIIFLLKNKKKKCMCISLNSCYESKETDDLELIVDGSSVYVAHVRNKKNDTLTNDTLRHHLWDAYFGPDATTNKLIKHYNLIL